MTKNLKQNLIDFRNVSLVELDKEGKELPISLHTVAINSLLATGQDEIGLSGVEKVKRFTLAQNIYKTPEKVELTKEELELIKTVIGKHAPTLVVGCVWDLLDKED